jgi:phosphate starvation-inducible PhoH-like protein
LPNARRSGLVEAMDVLKNVDGLAFTHFDETDVVRHHLVQRIVRAYDEHKTRVTEQQMFLLADPRSIEPMHAEAAPAGERKTVPVVSEAAVNRENPASAEAKG